MLTFLGGCTRKKKTTISFGFVKYFGFIPMILKDNFGTLSQKIKWNALILKLVFLEPLK